MVNYAAAIKRPFTDFKKILLGALILFVPILNFCAFGYFLKCAKTAMNRDYKMPEWKELGGLWRNGIKMAIIGFIYMIPALFFYVFVIISVFKGQAAVGMVLGLITLVIYLITVYVVPAAQINYIVNNRFGAGFDFKTVLNKAFTGKYFVALLITMLYGLVFGVAFAVIYGTIIALSFLVSLGFLILLPIFIFVVFILMNILMVTNFTILGEAFAEA